MENFIAILTNFIVYILIYFIITYPLYRIARKTGNSELGYMAFIPIANIALIILIADLPWYSIFLFLVPIVGGIFGIYLCMKFAKACGSEMLAGLLLLLPVINIIYLYYLALSDSNSLYT